MKKTVFIVVVVGVVIGFGAFMLFGRTQLPTALNQDLYPLYSGVSWGEIKSASVDGAVGYEALSEPILNINNIAASSTPFTDYYRNKLTAAGWTQDMSREAGGPGAEVSVYTKGNEFVIVSFHTNFHTKPTNAPEQCPCDLQFSLISGATK